MFSFVVVLAIIGNILSVVGVVICNKYIVEVDGYNFMIFLSFLHFVFTYMGSQVLLQLNVFQYKEAPLAGVMPVAIGSLLSVAFMNLNLSTNSVGFYQLSKLICIPFTLFVQYIAYKETTSKKILWTLVPITFGVGYATVYDLSLNAVGVIFASCAIVATAMAQIFTNTYQKSLGCDALQLLYHTSPIIGLGMLVMCPMFDNLTNLYNFTYTVPCMARIALSCVFALGVNISNYIVLGKTNPLTYQVLGHLKTVLILVLGFTFFNKQADIRNIIGIVIAMAGVITYTEIKRQESAAGSVVVNPGTKDIEFSSTDDSRSLLPVK